MLQMNFWNINKIFVDVFWICRFISYNVSLVSLNVWKRFKTLTNRFQEKKIQNRMNIVLAVNKCFLQPKRSCCVSWWSPLVSSFDANELPIICDNYYYLPSHYRVNNWNDFQQSPLSLIVIKYWFNRQLVKLVELVETIHPIDVNTVKSCVHGHGLYY